MQTPCVLRNKNGLLTRQLWNHQRLGYSQSKWQRARRWFRGGQSFFVGDKPPVGLPMTAARGREIEQTLPNDPTPYFVSLFDPCENTPFYSAYKVTPEQARNIYHNQRSAVQGIWKDPPGGLNVLGAYKEAVQTDKQTLQKGHMNPVGINTFDTRFMEATFTLTNAVPQFETSNKGDWEKFEKRIRDYAQNTCGPQGGTLYLLTGKSSYGLTTGAGGGPVQDIAIPLPYTRENFPDGVKLVTPRAIWTAGCCVWAQPGNWLGRLWTTKRAQSFAVMSNNHYNQALLHQTEMSVTELERLLKAPALKDVNLFPGDGNCRLAANYKKLPP